MGVNDFFRGFDSPFKSDAYFVATRRFTGNQWGTANLFTNSIAAAKIPVLDVASRSGEIGAAVLPLLNSVATPQHGLEITSFAVESICVPAEVEQAVDKRASTAVIGNLNEYAKYQVGQGLATGASGGGPTDVAKSLGGSEADVMTVLENGERKGKKIGATWRIPRAALNNYLSQ